MMMKEEIGFTETNVRKIEWAMALNMHAFDDASLFDFAKGVDSEDFVPVKTLNELYPDPVERIEHVYGPEDSPHCFTKPMVYRDTWDEDRLKIATDPRYTNRCLALYAFRDLIGREYDGVVFE